MSPLNAFSVCFGSAVLMVISFVGLQSPDVWGIIFQVLVLIVSVPDVGLSSGHRTGKCQFSFQSQRKAMPKNAKNYCTITLISRASKVILKIHQARLQQYMNCGPPDVQASFRKGRGTRNQLANIHWIIDKTWQFQKNIYSCSIDYAKTFDCVDHNKLWKILQERGIPDHLTCLLRNLYAGQEATVRTGHGTVDWFQIGKGVHLGWILPPSLFNLYAEYIMRKAGLREAQAGIKIAGRNISNLRNADNTTLIVESEKELKSLLKVKEESESESCVVMSDSLRPRELYSPWNFLGQNTGVGCHFRL